MSFFPTLTWMFLAKRIPVCFSYFKDYIPKQFGRKQGNWCEFV